MAGRLALLVLVGSVLAFAGCGSGTENGGGRAAEGTTRLVELENVLQLRAAFNDDRRTGRLLLVLSPT